MKKQGVPAARAERAASEVVCGARGRARRGAQRAPGRCAGGGQPGGSASGPRLRGGILLGLRRMAGRPAGSRDPAGSRAARFRIVAGVCEICLTPKPAVSLCLWNFR